MFELTPEHARRKAEDWCAAWNRRDLDAVMVHYAQSVVLCSPTVLQLYGVASGQVEGRDRVREYFEMGMALPGLRFELIDALAGLASMCVIFRRETGQVVSDTVELDSAGKIIRVVACYGIKP